jgi:heptosyltransferase-3
MTHSPVTSQQPPISRILLIKLRHHGDMLLTTPVINTLKNQYPDAEIDVLMYQETRDMLACHPAIHQLFTIDRQWKKLGIRRHMTHEIALAKQLMHRHYDLVVNLADQWRSAIITRLTGARLRLGFDFAKRQNKIWRWCHNQLVTTDNHNSLHTVEQNLSILAPLALPTLLYDVTMSYSEQDSQAVQQCLQQQGINGAFIVIQPTSRWFFKCWTEEKMAQTINALSAQGYCLVLTSGPDAKEREMVKRIQALSADAHVVSLAGQLTLRQLAALIDKASLFIGVDSVPMHMAAALKTPLVALFGPSKLTFWHPWQAADSVIWAGDYGTLPDPDDIDTHTDQRYLDAIAAEVVIARAKERLS